MSLGVGDAIVVPPRSADRRAALALSLVQGVGPVTYLAWATSDGGADASFARRLDASRQRRALEDADVAVARARSAGATLLLLGDPSYPAPLLELPDPPPALWCLGDTRLLEPQRARVALVGTRAATAYGLRVADAFAGAASVAGVIVVSGMALGIDAAAHVGALAHDGGTIAVLGSGVDVPYPRSHRELHARIAREGLVLSEFPPGAQPTPGAFPRRNRIVAALARATVVVEAGARSGALITASLALELGRDVGAVPGPIDAQESMGTNALLRDGAALIAEERDLLSLVDVESPRESVTSQMLAAVPDGVGDDEERVWSALAHPARGVEELASRTRLGTRECVTALGLLEAAGHVRTAFDGSIGRR